MNMTMTFLGGLNLPTPAVKQPYTTLPIFKYLNKNVTEIIKLACTGVSSIFLGDHYHFFIISIN